MQAASGTDYRFAGSPWHVSYDFRSMGFGNASGGGPETGFFPGAVVGTNSANATEGAFEADFMVGRDFGIGWPGQWKVGVRVADLYSQTNGTASWPVRGAPSPATQTRTYQLNDGFIGAGPRVAVEGGIPLQGKWSFDYNGGIAGLVGKASATQTVTVVATGVPAPVCVAGCPINVSNSGTAFAFNADVQAGFSYWVTPAAKLSVLYRFDGYWNALGGFNSAGGSTNLTRYYQGPTLRFTMTY
jgi:hypothetical protein